MGRLFTSDWHFNHSKILEYSLRPFYCLQEMEEEFFQNLLKMYKPGDILYFLGDLAFCGKTKCNEILSRFQMEGIKNIIYIYGNHDYPNRKVIANHPSITWTGNLKSISFKIDSYKYEAMISHYPMRSWNKSAYGSFMIHGHCHGNIEIFRNSIDIGIDNANNLLGEYRPFTEKEIVSEISNFNDIIKEIENKRVNE